MEFSKIGTRLPKGGHALAIDIGGTKVDVALVDTAGQLVRSKTHRAHTGPGATPDSLREALRLTITAALTDMPASGFLVGVGIGSAGPVDRDRGTIAPLNMPALADTDVVNMVSELVPDAAVQLRLDGTCIALAEAWQGANRGVQNSMTIVVSTGIGGGLIVDGRLLEGASGNAGHIGQTIVGDLDWSVGSQRASETATEPPKPPGETLEAAASGPGTVRWASSHGFNGSTGEELAHAYASHDPVATLAVKRSATYMGRAIASAAALLDLEQVAIGGGFASVTEDYVGLIRSSVREHAVLPSTRSVRVVRVGLGNSAPLVGAGALALN